MGTNYYLKRNVCKHCGRGDDELHIGKSSAGWCFSLHYMPEEGINSLLDWKALFTDDNIYDEYSQHVSIEIMLDVITNRSNQISPKPHGYKSWEEFHSLNHSEFGPNGLLRHRVDGSHCIRPGKGTWDLIAGEFS